MLQITSSSSSLSSFKVPLDLSNGEAIRACALNSKAIPHFETTKAIRLNAGSMLAHLCFMFLLPTGSQITQGFVDQQQPQQQQQGMWPNSTV